ncbi:TIGR00341 family protein [Prevotella melaninogenica]|jgi:TIGR00341 family protein|uniref:TIGR00341 family protein n=1 Tax=Prevotella melaninogenica TaxID=28132 RepID=UPI001C5CEF65|nr:TIGR00341 family protein [Prevotella melaninogenica]MBW4729530.1 TIGR00341 family protein [Prevotella melaninogenica]MBW4732157.1 TIGR00341 family protein [Prevotella melaninogenica]MBW4750177.1 TIGR00341 family protein [Prevotella melaninogenica]
MQENNNQTLWQIIKRYFNVLPYKDGEKYVIKQITNGINFQGSNLWILIFAVFIASLGLNVNSTAVIIGAMLISPLMGPIIGMGLALGIADLDLFKQSIKNYLVSTFISVITATIYFTLSPITDAQSELLARTSPTLYDVLIALFGGAAGFLAMSTKGRNNVVPGVAIATALMPPLCTAGYGLAVQNTSYFFGAFYLYFINTVFIAFTTCLGVRFLHFHRKQFINREKMRRVNLYIVSIIIITIIPASYMTWNIIKQSVFENNIDNFVTKELNYSGTNILSHQYDLKTKTLHVVAVGNPISTDSIAKAQKAMTNYQLDGYALKVIQGSNSDSLLLLQHKNKGQLMVGEKNTAEWQELAYRNDVLQKQLNSYTHYPVLANDMREELKVVCPSAKSIMLSKASESFVDSASIKNHIVAIVKTNKTLAKDNRKQLYDWLKVKVKSDSLELIILP